MFFGNTLLENLLDVLRSIYKPMNPDFALIDPDLWQWREWFIALAHDAFWVLTPHTARIWPLPNLRSGPRKGSGPLGLRPMGIPRMGLSVRLPSTQSDPHNYQVLRLHAQGSGS